MNMKERWLSALRFQPVDKLSFWPKLGSAYLKAQSKPFCKMSLEQVIEWTGGDIHHIIDPVTKEIRKKTYIEIKQEGNTRRTVYITRYGSTEQIEQFDNGSQAWHPIIQPVKDIKDIRIMTEWYRDCRVELDSGKLELAGCTVGDVGKAAATFTVMGESPLMYFVEWMAGVENANFLLSDYPGEVEELFSEMDKVLMRHVEIAADKHPADMLYLSENTSTTLISPAQYRKYCFKHILRYGETVKSAGRLFVLHMCGHIKALLPDLGKLPVDAFEAFTSPTLGNTTLLDGRTICPDKCLIGGTNAIVLLQSAGKIIAQLEEDLDALPHHRGLLISSAGGMPPACRPETIKEVCEWVKSYKLKM